MADGIKARLLKPRIEEDTVEVPGVGEVRVRGLSRHEVLFDVQKVRGGRGEVERRMLVLGVVDPDLSEEEVVEWQKAATATEIEPVIERIAELSGMFNDEEDKAAAARRAEREAMRSFRDEPDA